MPPISSVYSVVNLDWRNRISFFDKTFQVEKSRMASVLMRVLELAKKWGAVSHGRQKPQQLLEGRIIRLEIEMELAGNME